MSEAKKSTSCAKLLQSLDLCPRCRLRFLGEKKYTSYICKEQVYKSFAKLTEQDCLEQNHKDGVNSDDEGDGTIEITNNENCDPVPKRHQPSLCSVCLGILQNDCDTMAEKVEAAVKASNYQFSSFLFQVSLPVTTDLRQKLMHYHIKEILGSQYNVLDTDIPSIKDVWKWVVGSKFGDSVKAEFDPHSDFQICITIQHPDLVKDCDILLQSKPEAFPKRRRKKVEYEDIFSRAAVQTAMSLLSDKLKNLYSLPPVPSDKPCIYKDITCTRSPLYVGGRYNKYTRELSQTPWIVDGERRMESSVQERITDCVQKWIPSDKIVFSASGREDVDVKMLGNGRPFVLEIINSKCSSWTEEQMKNIENNINSTSDDIFIRNLQVISKNDIQFLKVGEEHKKKSYAAVCIVKRELSDQDVEKLNSFSDLELKQLTPIRVLHRRPLAMRRKVIHKIDAKIVGPHEIKLLLETQAGTYVKEFIHGDFGRTIPSLGTLLETEADILKLDVTSIDLDWPPEIKS